MHISNFFDCKTSFLKSRPFYLSVLLCAVSIGAACRQASAPSSSTTNAPASSGVIAPSNGVAAQNSYADVVSRVTPAVITVRSERRARPAQQFPFADDPRFREFFGGRVPQQAPQRQSGLGSGVIVSTDGHILTNHHVVDGAEEITVEFTDRRTFKAKLVGSDAPSDLAVLKIDAGELPVLPLGDSDRVRVGDVALAIGNPLGLEQTVTAGIISAKGRATGLSDGSFEDFLQTDAPINQGNSGGALINTNGELIGINSQILSPSGGNIGIGFAIPSNMAKNVMEQLISGGKVRRGSLGVTIQPVTSDLAASLNLKDVRGALVNSVARGSAAERAGLKRGDVILALNDRPVNDTNSLRNAVAGTQPGAEVTLTIFRNGDEQEVRATLGELDAGARAASQTPGGNDEQPSTSEGQLGIRIAPLTAEQRRELDLPADTRGLFVAEVNPSGAAGEAGIAAGDVIVEINNQPVNSTTDLRAALERAGERPSLLLVNRRGDNIFLTVRPRR
ncbi:MAG: DegQ family serine endoprotease [Pyrinomonadaceae bacterium MAG19_C2-C3]|nr:DegQ family serine endoprotease [Pyrinomonadaceae bacterium MAG19_C2-C3]